MPKAHAKPKPKHYRLSTDIADEFKQTTKDIAEAKRDVITWTRDLSKLTAELKATKLYEAKLKVQAAAEMKRLNLTAKGALTFTSAGAALPKGKAVIGYKHVHHRTLSGRYNAVLKLLIPANAQRNKSYEENKCRASSAIVLGVVKTNAPVAYNAATKHRLTSTYDSTYEYTVGKLHRPTGVFNQSSAACASGIHFFLTARAAAFYGGMRL